MVPRSVRVGLLIALPILFAVIGCGLGGNIWRFLPRRQRVEEKAYPLPHHFAKYPGNLTFRFAMAHDVIHERFPHHGPAFYRARNREVEQALPKTPPAARGKGPTSISACSTIRVWGWSSSASTSRRSI